MDLYVSISRESLEVTWEGSNLVVFTCKLFQLFLFVQMDHECALLVIL